MQTAASWRLFYAMYAQIALLSPPYSTLTYGLPVYFPDSFWLRGLRVAAPLGKNPRALRSGCILNVMDKSGLPANLECKNIHFPLETAPILDEELVDLAENLALRQGTSPGGVLGRVLPAGIRSTSIKLKWLSRQKTFTIYEAGICAKEAGSDLTQAILAGNAFFSLPNRDEAAMEMLALQARQPWPVRPAAKKQIEILDYLHQTGMCSRRMLVKSLGAEAAQPLKTLIRNGLVSIERGYGDDNIPTDLLPPPSPPFNLNPAQANALDDMKKALRQDGSQARLLYGVTGSGKTAVYLELARHILESDQSIVLLAPEVALAHKLYRDALQVIPGSRIVLYHGYQIPSKREAIFRELAENKIGRLVIGTRSALFLPLYKPTCIILDEEHDSSFKQDERMAYHAKEVAWHRARQNKGLLVLGSATPDIRTFYASQNGGIPRLCLPKRIGAATLPAIKLVDMAQAWGDRSPSGFDAGGGASNLLPPSTVDALNECLSNGEQAVVLLNRRGYAPFIYCIECEKTLRCPHCEIGLNYHKSARRLICHYCNYSMPFPAPCPTCGTLNYMALGEGTERLTEQLEAIAGQPILRLDRDNARRQGEIENILGAFANGDSPFLVGTQMLSKGHHFPNVTLVVVADGDIGLNLPDYRAAERTFQLLTQAAGRAGRGSKPGRVIIQTRNCAHYFWRYIVNYDYEGFYEDELARRRRMLYPPFTCLALLRISFAADYADGPRAVESLGSFLREKAREAGARLLGPAPAPIAMLRGQKRFHCLLKCGQWPQARHLWALAQNFKPAARLDMFLDIDPVNML